MSLTGKSSLSIRRKDVMEQKSTAVGFKKIVFAHKATLGETGIDLSALVTPSEMASLGFVNPNSSDLLAANLGFYKSNLTLISSAKGVLIGDLSYVIRNASTITFQGFTAEDGEIFTGILDPVAKTDLLVVDARPIVATGELDIGETDFNTGDPFEINKFSGQQVGSVVVYRNGVQQFRNPGNTTSGGNYQEVNAGNGFGTLIRFNSAPVSQADSILVVSNGLLVERPAVSMMANIEVLAGQIDAMIPTLASLAGVDETEFQTAPNNQDLKQFGDTVLDHETRIDDLEIAKGLVALKNTGNHTLNGNWQDVTNWVSAPISTHGSFNLTTGEHTFASSGYYLVTAKVGFSTNATGGRGVKLMVNNIDVPGSAQLIPATAANGVSPITTMLISVTMGDALKVGAYQSSGGNLAYEINADGQIQISIVKIGN